MRVNESEGPGDLKGVDVAHIGRCVSRLRPQSRPTVALIAVFAGVPAALLFAWGFVRIILALVLSRPDAAN